MSGPPNSSEETFRNYNKDQSVNYAKVRFGYHPSVYEAVLDHHVATGGQMDTVLDIGCGPGLATKVLAGHFNHAFGLDPGEGMISVARGLDLKTASSAPVQFDLSTAEELVGIADESVDLITAANAAHWFDMAGFWVRAAQVLKPGGSVALWTSGELSAHPDMPQAAAINETMHRIQDEYLLPYFKPGNLLTKNGYRDLVMPWDTTPVVDAFDRASLYRKQWELSEPFFVGQRTGGNMELFEQTMGTGSPVTRWRAAHPDLVGTEKDVVRLLRREIEKLLHAAGVAPGEEILEGAVPGVLLMVKKPKRA